MTNKRLVGVCFYSVILYGMFFVIYSPLLPSIAQTFDLSLSQAGVIFTVSFTGYLIITLLSGFFSDKYGKKLAIAINLLGSAIALFIIGFISEFSVLLICMFFAGGCSGSLEAVVSAYLVDLNPKKEAFFVNAAQIFFGLGAIIAPILVGWALTAGISWMHCYLALSFLFLICLIVLFTTKVKTVQSSDKVQLKQIKTILSSRKVRLLCVCMLCYSGSETSTMGWLGTYLQSDAGFSTMFSSLAISALYLFMVAGRVGCLGALKKIDERKIVIALAFSTVIGLIVSAFAQNEFLIWVGLGITGIGYSAQWPLILAYGLKDWPGYSGTVASLMIMGTTVGMIIMPALAGFLGDLFGLRITMAFPAIALTTIALIFINLLMTHDGDRGTGENTAT